MALIGGTWFEGEEKKIKIVVEGSCDLI